MTTSLKLSTIIFTSILLSGCTIPFLSQQAATTDEATSMTDKKTEIMAALQTGQPLKCAVTTTTEGQTMEYFLKGKQFRMMSITTVDGQTSTTHAISDGEYLYSWSEPQNQGIKMKLATEAELQAQTEQYQNLLTETPDFTKAETIQEYENNGYNINCEPTAITDAIFVPPSTIQFQDMSTLLNNSMMQLDSTASPEQMKAYEEALQQYGN